MLSLGTFSDLAFSIAIDSALFFSGSDHHLAAISINFACFQKIFHFFSSFAHFLCFIVAHLLCHDIKYKLIITYRLFE